jgi:phosphatidylserine/phosphatidylglycerophosphate/cardiolipin synthase-like enzyme
MHEKFMVHHEGDDVFNGSANISRGAETRNAEDRFFLKNNPEVAAAFRAEFARLWEVSRPA